MMTLSSTKAAVTLTLLLSLATNVAGTETAPGRCQMDGSQEGAVAMDCDESGESDLNLMQFRGAGTVQRLSTQAQQQSRTHVAALDSQYNFIQELVKKHSNGEALPDAIGPMLTSIWQDARDVQKELEKEHDLMAAEADNKKESFKTCDDDLNAKLPTLEEEHGVPTQTHFGIFCNSAKDLAESLIDQKGCENVKACKQADLDKAKEDLDTFMTADHCDACNNNDWESAGGTTKVEQMTTWLAGKQGSCEEHYDTQLTTFDDLYEKYVAANTTFHDVKGQCEELDTKVMTNGAIAGSMQCSTTTGQCTYISEVEAACAVRDQCYKDKTHAWTEFKGDETKGQVRDYQDRIDGFMSAQKIKCILRVFTIGGEEIKDARHKENPTGEVTVDPTKAEDCLTRLAKCSPEASHGKKEGWTYKNCNYLNMAEILDWTPPTPEACPTPAEFCTDEGWVPKCESWDGDGGYTPEHTNHALTAGSCDEKDPDEQIPRDDTTARDYEQNCNKCEKYE